MKILETQIVQREFDQRWEKLARVLDRENTYHYVNENGIRSTLIPEKWITLEVFDFIMEETPECQT